MVIFKKKPKPKTATFESATTPATFAGTNKPLVSTPTSQTPQPQTTGVYNKEKGGYVTPKTTYPTNNPNFVPGATGQPGTSIEFTKDGNVIVDGRTLTREQYQNEQKTS